MCSRDLPDMYALGPAALGLRAYISGKSLVPMLQLFTYITTHYVVDTLTLVLHHYHSVLIGLSHIKQIATIL